MNIGLQIRKIRRSKDLTQEQVAEMIGMPTCNFCSKEKNDTFTRQNIYKICKALGLSITIKENE
jgi:transcriptional regulator with XRE-family HTH domain